MCCSLRIRNIQVAKSVRGNTVREMESGFKECLPPKTKGFTIKRQAKLTPYQAKHLHFYTPTRKLEADKMVDALNRLDQTDALVEQLLGDRAKVEQSAKRGHVQSNHYMQRHPSEAEVPTRVEPNHHTVHGAESDSEREQLDRDPERLMVMLTLWLTRTGPLWYLFRETDHRTKPKQVRCQLGHKVFGQKKLGDYKPESGRSRKGVRKTLIEKKPFRRPKRPHTIP